MSDQNGSWLDLAHTISHDIGKGPINFVLGAGASMSSGGPSLARLERRWMDSNSAAYPDRKALLEKISELNDTQKINPIASLFDSIHPYIGYYALASLARERPVFVLNLNWDRALEQACLEMPDVDFHHLTVGRDGDLIFTTKVGEKEERVLGADFKGNVPPVLDGTPARGVYCLQVHGRFGDDRSGIRIGTYDTLQFTPIVKRTIIGKFFCHPTIVVGASLEGEFDIVDLLMQLTQEPRALPRTDAPIYVFSRQETRTAEPSHKLTQQILYRRSSYSNFRGDPAVDFDHLLLELASNLRDVQFGDPFRRTEIPSLKEIALPTPKVLGPKFHPFRERLTVIEGDAQVGRTIAAAVLAHMARLCDSQDEGPRVEVEVHTNPAECEKSLAALDPTNDDDRRVLILENPFGTTDAFRKNERFIQAFNAFAKKAVDPLLDGPRVIVTTRASNWRLALAESKLKRPENVVSIAIDDWYYRDELTAYLEAMVDRKETVGRDEGEPLLRREIDKGELATPAAIDSAVLGGVPPQDAMVVEKVAFLGAISPDAAWCAVLARLQELWPNGVADLPLHNAADREAPAFVEASLMLRTVELDGQSYVVPAHSTDREAIDRFFADNYDLFERRLADLGRRHGSAHEACELWLAIQELRKGKLGRVKKLPAEVRLNWGATLLDEAARSAGPGETAKRFNQVRQLLLKDPQHFWSMRELVFETIRLWPKLQDDPATLRFLEDVLSERAVGNLEASNRMGAYLMLEAMLYVQAATYPWTWDMEAYHRIWAMLSVARHALQDHPEDNATQLALMFDAFNWCPPRLEKRELRSWLESFAKGARACSRLRTAMICSSLHHPEGFALLIDEVDGLEFAVEELQPADAEMASFLISWHFVHQSRARALLYRRNLEPAHFYLLHRIPGPLQPAIGPIVGERCKRFVAELSSFEEHAGWAVHLAMSLAVQRGLDASFVAQQVSGLREADQGAIAAAMTYRIPSLLRPSFLKYFDHKPNLDALLDAMSKPHEIDGVMIGPPPFCASRFPWHLYGALEIGWERLEEEGLPIDDEYAFLEMLFSVATDLEEAAESEEERAALRQATAEAAAGDLRSLERVPLRNTSAGEGKMGPQEVLAERLAHAADEIRESSG